MDAPSTLRYTDQQSVRKKLEELRRRRATGVYETITGKVSPGGIEENQELAPIFPPREDVIPEDRALTPLEIAQISLRRVVASSRNQIPKRDFPVKTSSPPPPSVLPSVEAEVALPNEGVQVIEEAGVLPQEIPSIIPPSNGNDVIKIDDSNNTTPLGEIAISADILEGEISEPGDQGPDTIQDDYHVGDLQNIPGEISRRGEADGEDVFADTLPPEEDVHQAADVMNYSESTRMTQPLDPLRLRILMTEEMRDTFRGKELQIELGSKIRHLEYKGLIIGSGDNLPMTWEHETNIYNMNEKVYAWLEGRGYVVLIPFEFLSTGCLESSGTISFLYKKQIDPDYSELQKEYMIIDRQTGTFESTSQSMGFSLNF